jgi:hypothetical protein
MSSSEKRVNPKRCYTYAVQVSDTTKAEKSYNAWLQKTCLGLRFNFDFLTNISFISSFLLYVPRCFTLLLRIDLFSNLMAVAVAETIKINLVACQLSSGNTKNIHGFTASDKTYL